MEDDSLLDSGDEQMELIPSDQMPTAVFSEDEAGDGFRNPQFTARRLFARDPDKYRLIVSLRQLDQLGVREVARLAHVSPNTVAAIDKREGRSAAVETQKQSAAQSYRWLAGLTRERLEEILLDKTEVKKVSAYHLTLIIGILEDKAQLLSGGATARLEVDKGAPSQSELVNYLESLRREYQTRCDGADGATKEGAAIDAEGEWLDPDRPAAVAGQDASELDPAGQSSDLGPKAALVADTGGRVALDAPEGPRNDQALVDPAQAPNAAQADSQDPPRDDLPAPVREPCPPPHSTPNMEPGTGRGHQAAVGEGRKEGGDS